MKELDLSHINVADRAKCRMAEKEIRLLLRTVERITGQAYEIAPVNQSIPEDLQDVRRNKRQPAHVRAAQ